MIPALFIGAVVLIVSTGLLVRLLARKQAEYDAASANADDSYFLRHGPTHDHPSRDSDRRGGEHSNHIGGVNP